MNTNRKISHSTGITVLAATLLLLVSLTGCYSPSPLYGKWADNSGDYISFLTDGSFNASINASSGSPVTYQGTYDTVDNVMTFTCTSPAQYQIITVWELDGAVLYLTWKKSDGTTQLMDLYHITR